MRLSFPRFATKRACSCGRVVKATDSKSVSLWERRFESYQLRHGFLDDVSESLFSNLGSLSSVTGHRFLDSLVVRISACHVEGPGSIPGRGEIFSLLTKSFVAPGEARTHNPGITLCTVYKYRALTDCATGANWKRKTIFENIETSQFLSRFWCPGRCWKVTTQCKLNIYWDGF